MTVHNTDEYDAPCINCGQPFTFRPSTDFRPLRSLRWYCDACFANVDLAEEAEAEATDPRNGMPCVDCGQTFAWGDSTRCGWCDANRTGRPVTVAGMTADPLPHLVRSTP